MKKNHAVLTDEEGAIVAVIGYDTDKELVRKTQQQIEIHVLEAINEIPDNEIDVDRNICAYQKGGEKLVNEFHLTRTDIV